MGNFSVGQVLGASALNALTLNAAAPTTYTPTVTNGGTVTWTTITGWWFEIGTSIVFFNAYLVVNAAGSGASGLQITAPTNIDRTTRQVVTGLALASAKDGTWTIQANTSGSGATFDRINNASGTQITGADLSGGAIIAIQGWYRAG